MNESRIEDDGVVVTVIEEAASPQALFVRVGSVWDDDRPRRRPGIWIEYQEVYGKTRMEGPLLISEETWGELDRAVRSKFRRRESLWQRYLRSMGLR